MKTNPIIAGLLLLAATSFTACKPKDVEIKSNVSDAVKDDKVEVSVKDGVVTLSGKAPSPAAKVKAEAEARKVEGVQTVVNEITIPLPPPPPAPGHGLPSADEKLTGEVRAVIAPFPDVQASVNDGVVTLTGSISRPGLVLMMPRIAGLFPKKIENKLVIK